MIKIEHELIQMFNNYLLGIRYGVPIGDHNDFYISEYDEYSKIRLDPKGQRPLINDYLRFCISNHALWCCVQASNISEMHRWIVRALTDEYTGEQGELIYSNRLIEFIEDNPISTSDKFYETMISWLGFLYYYCRSRAALPQLASDYAPIAFRIIQFDNSHNVDRAFLLGSLLGWAAQVQHPLAKSITEYCELFEKDESLSKRMRCIASLTLGTRSGRLSTQSSRFWAQHTLNNYYSELATTEKLQMSVTVWDLESKSLENEIINLIHVFRQTSKSGNEDNVAQRYQDRHFNYLLICIANQSIDFKNTEFITKMVSTWLKIESPQYPLAEADVIWMSPFDEHGAKICFNREGVYSAHDSLMALQNVTEAGNLFNGTSISVNGLDVVELHVPDRYGYPESANSRKFEEAISNSYFPLEICNFLNSSCANAKSQIIFQSKAYPFQGVQMKLIKNTWPLTASFLKPCEDAKIERVAVWSGAKSATEEMEINAIKDIFGKVGILVDSYDSDNLSIDDFKSMYMSGLYQVIWLVSHGEYNHFDSKAATVQISAEAVLSLDDLLECSVSNQTRRLLFLNVCDGAMHPGNELIPRLGFAAALARDNQATMSNLWPVEGRTAAAFGAIYAINLANGLSFFEAYKSTISSFINESHLIPDLIESFIGHSCELTDRLNATNIDYSALSAFGAVSFYE